MNIDISYKNAPGHLDALLYTIIIENYPSLYGSKKMRNYIDYADMWNHSTEKIWVDCFTSDEIVWSQIPNYNDYRDVLLKEYPHHTDSRVHIYWPQSKEECGDTFARICRKEIVNMDRLIGSEGATKYKRKQEAECLLNAIHDKIMVHYCLMTLAADNLQHHTDVVPDVQPAESLVQV